MAVIDSHAHIYPNKIAARAVSAISQFYNIPMENQHGTPEALLAECEGTPITHFIVHSVATTAHAVTSINNFISEQCKLASRVHRIRHHASRISRTPRRRSTA